MAIGEALLGAAGGLVDTIFGRNTAEREYRAQKEFAKMGVRWKVEDAKAAGIHPLYALGANTMSYAPVSVGTDFAGMGQNIGRAIDTMRTPAEKESAFNKTVEGLTLTRMGLENELLQSQIRVINQPGNGPGMPVARSIPGQGSTAPADTMSAGPLTIQVDPGNTPAQRFEDQYGEVAGSAAGIVNLVSDLVSAEARRFGSPSPGPADIPAWLSTKIRAWLDTNYINPNQSLRDAMMGGS